MTRRTLFAQILVRCQAALACLAAVQTTAVASDPLLPGRLIPYGVTTPDLEVADFDGDGRSDILIGTGAPESLFHQGEMSLLHGRGDGTFEVRRATSSGESATGPFLVVDLNRDGRLDVVLSSFVYGGVEISGGLSVLLGRGDGTFAPVSRFAFSRRPPFHLNSGDFDGDGMEDLVALSEGEQSCGSFGCYNTLYYMWVLMGEGDGTFAAPIRMTSDGPFPAEVGVADFDGDGLDDLAVGDAYGNVGTNQIGLSLLLSQGGGNFRNTGRILSGLAPTRVRASDLNLDGAQDLVVFASAYGDFELSVLLGRGDGAFDAPAGYASGSFRSDILIADLNGDGAPDLSITDDELDEVFVLLNDQSGSFSPAGSLVTAHFPLNLRSADFNSDGITDLAVGTAAEASLDYAGHPAGPREICLLLGTGGGSFHSATIYTTEASLPGPQPLGRPTLASGDLDRNGMVDLLRVNMSTSDVSVLLARPDGTYDPDRRFATGRAPRAIAVADFNGDARLDVVTSNDGSLDLTLLLGLGDGNLAPPIRLPFGSPPSIVAGDFNRDGNADLALGSSGGRTIPVYLGQGDGTFRGPTFFDSVGTPDRLTLADVNRDGIQDIVVILGPLGGSLALLLGNGDGTFSSGQLIISLPYVFGPPVAIAVAIDDLDDDGLPDMAVVDENNWRVQIFRQSTSGSFERSSTLHAGLFPSSIAIGDLNGDGQLDLIVGNESPFYSSLGPAGDLSIFLQNADGEYPNTGTRYASGVTPHALLLADLNADGALDVAIAVRQGVSVLLNQPDQDHDGIADSLDACVDTDGDGAGDPGIASNVCRQDNCPTVANPNQEDVDGDGTGDVCDNCQTTPNPDQSDANGDGGGDACQPTLRLLGIRHTDDETLRVSIAAADPNGDTLSGRLMMSAEEQVELALPNLFFSMDCNQILLPEGIPGEGIGFASDGLAYYFFDVTIFAGFYGLPCVAPSAIYGLFPERCDHLASDSLYTFWGFDSSAALPLPLCAVKFERDGRVLASSPRFDILVQAVNFYEAGILTIKPTTLAFDFVPGQAQRFDISSLAVGTDHQLKVSVSDGNSVPATISVALPYQGERELVIDSGDPPQAVLRTHSFVECDRPGGALVTLDGSESRDPFAGTPVVSFDWFADPDTADPPLLGSGSILTVALPLGSTSVELRVTTADGRTGTDRAEVTVADTTPPTLMLATDPMILWPPDHRVVPVRVTLQAADSCDPLPLARLMSVIGNEPDDAEGDGDGRTTGDVSGADLGMPDTEIMLRAERSAQGAGRTYRLIYMASDTSDNTASALTVVTVPHDRGPEE